MGGFCAALRFEPNLAADDDFEKTNPIGDSRVLVQDATGQVENTNPMGGSPTKMAQWREPATCNIKVFNLFGPLGHPCG